MGWTIKQASEQTGIPADTLRYYDKEGIVSPKRAESGYRLYDDDDILHLKNAVVMKYARFTLVEMKSMEELFRRDPGADCNAIGRDVLLGKIAELRRTIDNYRKIIALMEELLPMLDGDEVPHANRERIDAFIGRIFEDIRGGERVPHAEPPHAAPNESEVG